MDLVLFMRVMWRFRVIVLCGLTLGLALAVISFYSVELDGGKPGFTHRTTELWQAHARLLVTQEGFPIGRAAFPSPTEERVFAAPARFSELALIYANLANSDAIERLISPKRRLDGTVAATAPTAPNSGYTLPIIELFGSSATPQRAIALTQRASKALQTYVRRGQVESRTPPSQRVTIQQIARPDEAILLKGRNKVVPISLFLAVAVCSIGLAFVMENLRPTVRPVAAPSDSSEASSGAVSTTRLSA